MKIVITGANGYIGARLCEFLSKSGHQVIAVCFPEIPIRKGWNELIYQTIIGDVTNQEIIKQISEMNADAIIHLVSLDYNDSEKDPNMVMKVNVQPTWDLLDKCTSKGLKKFIYFSTIHVYGHNQNGTVEETQLPTPINAYGLTHYLSEEICNYFNRKAETVCINVRLSNSYGEPIFSDANCWDLIVNDITRTAFRERKIILKSDGTANRDFIHYSAICDNIEELLKIDTASYTMKSFHLSSGYSNSLIEVASIVKTVYQERYKHNIEIYVNNTELVTKKIQFKKQRNTISNKYINSLLTQDQVSLKDGINSIFNYLECKSGFKIE